MKADSLEIFLTATPGLEAALFAEAEEKDFNKPEITKGGVTVWGDWAEVWRANLMLRGATRVLARLGSFKVQHLAKLDKLARKFPWSETLRSDVPVRIEVSCKTSRIYHSKAAAERFETALKEVLGVEISQKADICIKIRIVDDVCTISVDTSGEALHKRGHKEAVNKAPMRENLAALLLRECGYSGAEPVIDPMCGSGTFVIEAAEIAAGLAPGRTRNFAFEKLANFKADTWQKMKDECGKNTPEIRFYGFDRDAGAMKMSTANAKRAGVTEFTEFKKQSISELTAPEGPKGFVIINPPYGARIGDTKHLHSLYETLGKTLKAGFRGWRIGLVTNSDDLAKACGLPFRKKKIAFSHGGISVKLYSTLRI